jgi:hypothetical protein
VQQMSDIYMQPFCTALGMCVLWLIRKRVKQSVKQMHRPNRMSMARQRGNRERTMCVKENQRQVPYW